MRIGERVLLALSRAPEAEDYPGDGHYTPETALADLRREFPDLAALVRGRRVLDFGCGSGWQVVGLAHAGAALSVGVDSNAKTLAGARALAQARGLGADRVQFHERLPGELRGRFDVVVSQNAMEHFADPAGVLREMRAALAPGGRILVTFGPPWYAPSGSHMYFFTRVPWVNLLFSERTVMAVRARFRADGARRYEEVESGLNRMGVRRFERMVAACGLRMARRRYTCVKRVQPLMHVPLLRELFINNVACILEPLPAPAGRAPHLTEGGDAPRVASTLPHAAMTSQPLSP